MQRKPESAGKLREGGALVGGEEREEGEERGASGQRGGEIVEGFEARARVARPVAARSEKRERDGREMPGQDEAERCAQHPGERRIEDEARLAGAVVGAGRPVRIRNAVMPCVDAIEPGDEVDVEVVAAGVAANELRDDGDERGEEDDRWAGEEAQSHGSDRKDGRGARRPGLWRSPCSLVPWSLFFHGSRRSVCRVCAATAAGVKGSAKVVPLYQSFHWSRK